MTDKKESVSIRENIESMMKFVGKCHQILKL